MKLFNSYYFRNCSVLILRKETSSNTKTQETFTCSKLIIKATEKGVKYGQTQQQTLKRRQRRCSGVVVYFERISYLFLVFLLLTLKSKCLLEIISTNNLQVKCHV